MIRFTESDFGSLSEKSLEKIPLMNEKIGPNLLKIENTVVSEGHPISN
jgi:hypothetical protein